MNRVTRDSAHRSSDQIRRDIDRTRAEIDGTVSALEGRMTPGRMVDEIWDRVSRSGVAREGGIVDVIRDHPVPIALMGLGIGWLAVEQSTARRRVGPGTYARAPGRRGPYGPDAVAEGDPEESPGISDRVREAGAGAREKLREAGEKLSDATSGEGDGSLTERASEATSEAVEQTREQAQRARRGFAQMLEENPIALGALAFGVGLASAVAVPSTEPEDRMTGRMSDAVKRDAERVGEEAAERAKQTAREITSAPEEEASAPTEQTKPPEPKGSEGRAES